MFSEEYTTVEFRTGTLELSKPSQAAAGCTHSKRWRAFRRHWSWATLLVTLGLATALNAARGAEAAPAPAAALRFEVVPGAGITNAAREGRVFVVLCRTNHPEPRLLLGRTGRSGLQALAQDVNGLTPEKPAVLGAHSFSYPPANLNALPTGDYFVQAMFDAATDLRSANSPGNLYSEVVKVPLGPKACERVRLELTQTIPPEELPADKGQLRFVKIQSKLLSDFHGRPIFLRAGIVLPRGYDEEPGRRYPLWVRVGGLSARYSSVQSLMGTRSEFRKTWMADNTPRFILLQLDGAGPLGDPYYVNSANNGPYGDALTQELIPYIESKFRAVGQPRARVLSGVSTGGWVALALQVFYPEFFNGTWAACPDPVDFRALELVNIYSDDEAYLNKFGNERPSDRTLTGDVKLTVREEVGVENLLGRGNSYTRSGEQWGAWNAAFSPRGADGLPVPIWDPQTGRIDHQVAEQWKKYDLRLVLEQNWQTLAPKLQGKLHITAGEADSYFLNNAVHLLDESLAHVEPPFKGSIVYGLGKGHGWSNLSLAQMLEEMQAATEGR